jgi:hypothetical protein
MIPSNYQTANVSLNITVPENIIKENIIWKVYISPHQELFPNMLAEKGLAIDFGNEIVNPCPEIILKGYNITNKPIHDYVLLETKNLTDNVIYIRSRLFSQREAYITFNIMDRETNMLIYSAPEMIHIKSNYTNDLYNMTLNIPKVNQSTVYSIVMLSPDGSFENRLAEDRHYF